MQPLPLQDWADYEDLLFTDTRQNSSKNGSNLIVIVVILVMCSCLCCCLSTVTELAGLFYIQNMSQDSDIYKFIFE